MTTDSAITNITIDRFEGDPQRPILSKPTSLLSSYLLIAIACGLPLIIGAANPVVSAELDTAMFGQSTAVDLKNDRPIQLAQANICPEDNPSQFIHAETKNFDVYICGGDLPHVYVGIAKKNGIKIVIPLQESQNPQRFIAVKSDSNHRYTYILNRNRLTVLRNDKPIVIEAARWL
jgi:hypothetical protein